MDIIVATPEKLLDFHRPQDISLKKMELLIINDPVRILDITFIFGVKRII
jgi:ATP-dependent RNA helicase RhlB